MNKIVKKISLDEIRNLHGGYWRYDLLDYHYLYNHYFPSKKLILKLQEKLPDLVDNYPSNQKFISCLISKWKDEDYFNENNLVVGNGSSELIKILMQIMDKVTVSIPTFNEWIKAEKGKIDSFFAEEDKRFKIDIEKLITSANKAKSNFIVINNPNNPVGNIVTKEEIINLLKTKKIIVVDEAFIDFCPKFSAEDLVTTYNNLVIVKGCSKSMGFPGLRLGYILTTNNEIKIKVRELLPIWNINSLTEYFIEIFPNFKNDYLKAIDKTLRDKDELFLELKGINYLEPYESFTNFVFCRSKMDAARLTELLFTRHGILAKDGLNQKIAGANHYVRFGSKTKKENAILLHALKETERT